MTDGYFGTEAQIRLQRKSDRLTPWIMDTRGACVTGRAMAADDPDALGWDVIRRHLAEDGVFAFRWVAPAEVDAIREQLKDQNAPIQTWRGFEGHAADLRDRVRPVCETPLPQGLTVATASGAQLGRMQAFLAAQGIAPISTAALGGSLFPAVSLVLLDPAGKIAAAGWGAMLHNRFSVLADAAWAGLIAVDPAWRRLGLGRKINALVLQACLDDLGAKWVIEFAAGDNAASIAMIESCGLSARPEVSVVAASGGARYTR